MTVCWLSGMDPKQDPVSQVSIAGDLNGYSNDQYGATQAVNKVTESDPATQGADIYHEGCNPHDAAEAGAYQFTHTSFASSNSLLWHTNGWSWGMCLLSWASLSTGLRPISCSVSAECTEQVSALCRPPQVKASRIAPDLDHTND